MLGTESKVADKVLCPPTNLASFQNSNLIFIPFQGLKHSLVEPAYNMEVMIMIMSLELE